MQVIIICQILLTNPIAHSKGIMSNNLSYPQLFDLAQKAGFSGGSALTIAAIAEAESNGDPSAINHNKNGTTDYGVLQINSSNLKSLGITPQQAMDPSTAFNAAYMLSKSGTNFHDWTTYNDDRYVFFKPDKHEWTPYDSTKIKGAQNLGIDPSTGKPFKTANTINTPYKSTKTLGKSDKQPDQSNWLDDARKLGSEYLGSYGDVAKGVSTGWGSFKDLSNLPNRVLKVIIGVILIAGALIVLIAPTVTEAALGGTPEGFAKKQIKSFVKSKKTKPAKPAKTTKVTTK